MQPLVSVILPVRNGGHFLAAAVESILGQSFESLELILVDDHSTDASIKALPRTDSRLEVVMSSGTGVSAAFNTGMERARGCYVARMDADDLALPQRIQSQVEFLEQHPHIDICGACVEIFSEQELGGGNARYQNWLNACCTPDRINKSLFIESPIPNPTAMFRREALHRLGGYADPEWPEDYDLFLRADALGMQMGKPQAILQRWREHPDRLTRCDPRYARERFQAAKAHYLALDRLSGKGPIVIWGAGPGGRLFHDLLLEQGVPLLGFLDVHPRRIGGQKRGLPIWPIDHVGQLKEHFIVVAVGAAGVRPEIRQFLDDHGRVEGTDYLFVS
jgi:glycosyltransferase involved in cell wall biosynthesis